MSSTSPTIPAGRTYALKVLKKIYGIENEEMITKQFVDSGGDRSIDFYGILLNNQMYTIESARKFIENNRDIKLKISIYQVKSGYSAEASIQATEVDKLISFFLSVLEFSTDKIGEKEFIGNHNVLEFAKLLKNIHKNQRKFSSITLDVIYVANSSTVKEEENEIIRNDIGKNLSKLIKALYKEGLVNLKMILESNISQHIFSDAEFILELNDAQNDKIEKNDSLITIVNAESLLHFLAGEKLSFEKAVKDFNFEIFDANIRSFLGSNNINKGIIASYEKSVNTKEPFWIYNNGVTILCKKFMSYSDGSIVIINPQIINGLQTIMSFETFLKKNKKELSFEKLHEIDFLVKILATSSEVKMQDIILASNTQNKINYVDLISVNKYLKAIEDILQRNGIDYRRKKNQAVRLPKKDYIRIDNTTLLQLIVVSLSKSGPSYAKNKLKDFVENKSKSIFGFLVMPKKYDKLIQATRIHNYIKNDESACRVMEKSKILKYTKLHAIYVFLKKGFALNVKNLVKVENILITAFDNYNKDNGREKTYEQISKIIPNTYLK